MKPQGEGVTLWWLRRDLRLADNEALAAAVKRGQAIVPVFIRDEAVDSLGAAAKWRLGLGLQQLVLMLLPCLHRHTAEVVRVLEALIVHKESDIVSDSLARALSQITFMPDHPALGAVRRVLRRYSAKPGARHQLKECARGLGHESAAVRLMALQQLLSALQAARDKEAR